MPAPKTLLELEADVARDLDLTAHPRAPWLVPKTAGGELVLDCLIVGGGQCGLAVAHALKRDKVDNIAVLDRAEYGQEGPWITYARMRNLRSLKDQTGPDLRLPSLTYQAWHEAAYGVAHWEAMRWIPKELWQDYLHSRNGTARTPTRRSIFPRCAARWSPCSAPAPRPSTTRPSHWSMARPRSMSSAAGPRPWWCSPIAG
jgi:glycine/D-amino acid oxidase-like deaminating enzyme